MSGRRGRRRRRKRNEPTRERLFSFALVFLSPAAITTRLFLPSIHSSSAPTRLRCSHPFFFFFFFLDHGMARRERLHSSRWWMVYWPAGREIIWCMNGHKAHVSVSLSLPFSPRLSVCLSLSASSQGQGCEGARICMVKKRCSLPLL